MLVPQIITLRNKNGICLEISTLGATIMQLLVPNKNNIPINVVAGLESLDNYKEYNYTKEALYLGSTIGRYAGRISKGFFNIDGKRYPLFHQEGIHLHGGKEGFDKKVWDIIERSKNAVKLSYHSPHMEEGYPGNLRVHLTFTVTENNGVKLNYEAVTDSATHINLTNHSYFNLNGQGSILNHKLQIQSEKYLEVYDNLIPTGQLLPVKNSKFDYSILREIGETNFTGLDDTFTFNNVGLKAVLESEKSGLKMEVYSDQPAMVVYTPPKFPEFKFRDAVSFEEFPAICFETQHFPDTPHHKNFPTTLLRPNEKYSQETRFVFKKIN